MPKTPTDYFARVLASVDDHVGKTIAERRKSLPQKRRSQEWLGEHIGVSYQQIQKYEAGANSISAGKLYLIAKALGVPIADFFPKRG